MSLYESKAKQASGTKCLFLIGLLGASTVSATDLTIQLPGSVSIERRVVEYQCDSKGPEIGVPAGPFRVEYINGGGNSLAIVPVSGNLLIFTNVISGSGARYLAKQYTWWEGHGSVTLYSDTLAGKAHSVCNPKAAK